MEHPVDAVAEAERILEGLDMDVGGIHPYRLGDDLVDEARHPAVGRGDGGDVGGLLLRGVVGLQDEVVNGLGAEAVEMDERLAHLGLGAERPMEGGGAELLAEGRMGGGGGRGDGGEGERARGGVDGEDAVGARGAGGDVVDHRQRDRVVGERHLRDAGDGGEGAGDGGIAEEPALAEELVEGERGEGMARIELVHVLRREEPLRHEVLPEARHEFVGMIEGSRHGIRLAQASRPCIGNLTGRPIKNHRLHFSRRTPRHSLLSFADEMNRFQNFKSQKTQNAVTIRSSIVFLAENVSVEKSSPPEPSKFGRCHTVRGQCQKVVIFSPVCIATFNFPRLCSCVMDYDGVSGFLPQPMANNIVRAKKLCSGIPT